MAVYEISYDLRQPRRDYEMLYDALRRYTHCHALESVWLLDADQDATQIRDYLRQYMDSDDGLLVVRLEGNWAAFGLSNDCVSWLKQRFP